MCRTGGGHKVLFAETLLLTRAGMRFASTPSEPCAFQGGHIGTRLPAGGGWMSKTKGFAVLVGTVLLLAAFASPAQAAIHEQVAAYCSGGGVGVIDQAGFLEPPGITDPTKSNFAQPVLSDGVVVITASGPVTTDAPPSKYPAGSSPFALPAPDHPSTHCNALQP